MKKIIAYLVLLGFLPFLPAHAKVFVETFSTDNYKDSAQTTANWDTTLGKVTLHPIYDFEQPGELVDWGGQIKTIQYNGSYWLIGGAGAKLNKYNGFTTTNLSADLANFGSSTIQTVSYYNGMWMVGGQGKKLNFYDGVSFSDQSGNLVNWVSQDITATGYGGGVENFWLVTGKGGRINKYSGSTFTDLSGSPGWFANTTNAYALGFNGSYWLIGGDGGSLCKYQGGVFTDLSPQLRTSAFGTNTVYAIKWNGSTWMIGGSGSKVMTYNGTSFTDYYVSAFYNVFSIDYDTSNGFWLLGGNGTGLAPVIYSWDGSTWRQESSYLQNFGSDHPVFSIAYGNNQFFIGGEEARFNNRTGSAASPAYTDERAIISDFGIETINDIASDGTATMLVGGNAGRLNKYDGTAFSSLKTLLAGIGWGSANIQTIAGNGSYWLIGGTSGKLAKYDGSAMTDLTGDLGFSGSVLAIHWDGSYWLIGGSDRACKRYDGSTFTPVDLSSAFGATDAVNAISSGGGYWLIGGGSGSLATYDGSTVISMGSGLTNINAIAYALVGTWHRFLIGGSTSPQRLRVYDTMFGFLGWITLDNFSSNPVTSIAYNSLDNFFFISGGHGVLNEYTWDWGSYAVDISDQLIEFADDDINGMDCNGEYFLLGGTIGKINRYGPTYEQPRWAQSTVIDASSQFFTSVTLTAIQDLPAGTEVDYYLTANGQLADPHSYWIQATPGVGVVFDGAYAGTRLKWKAELKTSDANFSPKIDQITLEYYLPPTPTPTATITSTYSATPTITRTRTASPTRTSTPSPTATLTGTYTFSPTVTPTFTNSPTMTHSPTTTHTPTATPTTTPTATVTATFTPSITLTSTHSPTSTVSPTFTHSPTITPTSTNVIYSPTISPTSTPSPTSTHTPTITTTFTYTPTATPTSTATPTMTPTSTFTPTATGTFTATPTSTITLTATPTTTPTVTSTSTVTGTATPSPTYTATPSFTMSPSITPTSTETPILSPTPTSTVTLTPTWTHSPTATPNAVTAFESGTLIIPMDTNAGRTNQNYGMWRAYGLVYQLLKNGIPVYWSIKSYKNYEETDFVASITKCLRTDAIYNDAAYNGGPFIIDSSNSTEAKAIIDSWNSGQSNKVEVHQYIDSSQSLGAPIYRKLLAAPKIAYYHNSDPKGAPSMFRTKYMGPAGIPDSTGGNWPNSSPDVLDEDEIAGPSTSNHHDGALFTSPGGPPAYSMIVTYHWSAYPIGQYGGGGELNPDEGALDTVATDNAIETVDEMDNYLQYGSAHVYAQCVAVEALENDIISTTPTARADWIYGGHGHWLTTNGFGHTDATPLSFINELADAASGQAVGDWTALDSSDLAAFGLSNGSLFYGGESSIIVIDRQNLDNNPNYAYPLLFMNGHYKGITSCGKVSYMTGHESDPALPYTSNTAGPMLRYFYNSLFESPAAYALVPEMYLDKTGPDEAESNSQITYNITYHNVSGLASNAVLTDPYPTDATYVSSTGGGIPGGGVVTWDLGPLEDGNNGTVSVTYLLGSSASTWDNQAHVTYMSGLTQFTRYSNTIHTTMVVFTATPTVTPTVTRTPTPTFTATSTYSPTLTFTATATPSHSPTSTVTPTITQTYTATVTPTGTWTPTASPSATPTSSYTPTSTITGTATPTSSVTSTATSTHTPTVSPTLTASATFTPTSTATLTFTISPTATITPTHTPTSSVTLTSTVSVTYTPSPTTTDTPTVSPTCTASPTSTFTGTITPTSTITKTYTVTLTASPTATPSTTPTFTLSPTGTSTPMPTLTISGTITATITLTPTLTPSPTVSATTTPASAGSQTVSPTFTAVASGSLTPSPTSTPSGNATPSVTITPSPTATINLTAVRAGSATPTATPVTNTTGTPTVVVTPTLTVTTGTGDINIIVYPNPFNPKKAVNGKLKMIGLSAGDRVDVYTVSGEKVTSIQALGNQVTWEGTNTSGANCAAGVYIYTVYRGNKQIAVGKLFLVY